MRLLIAALILIIAVAFAQDAPGIVWQETYGTVFYDAHETSQCDFVIAGRKYYSDYARCAFLFSSDGALVWEYGVSSFYYQMGYWIEQLTDGSFVVTGRCKETESSSYAIFLAKIDDDGNEIWSTLFDIDDSADEGYCVIPLPDGGYAVGGKTDPSSEFSKGWILRTDSNGDTLWSVVIDKDYPVVVLRLLTQDNWITAFCWGGPVYDGDPFITQFTLDGELVWESAVYPFSSYTQGGDMCGPTSDGGFTFVTAYYPDIVHTDSLGNMLWSYGGIPGYGDPYGHSVNRTMDGGYIFGGENVPDPDHPWEEHSGTVTKLDSLAVVQWSQYLYTCLSIYSVRQLSQGGYIAAGQALGNVGILIRYAPETGIEEGSSVQTARLDISPNPFSASLSISYSLPEPTQVELSVYDLSGRLVDNLESGFISAGENTSGWNPDPGLPDGCYLIVLDACGERAVRRCVKLD